jgi:methylenetetrahydrofolate dehydrogenase (NADP+)/methenyltetrahydrofolate cyclohydrolase
VVGHSPIVGKPVACLITNDLGTCTICHIGTRDLKAHTTKAEILVVAAGKAGLVRGEHIKPGATVIDVGINRVPVLDPAGQPVVDEKGKKKMRTVGDVEFESAKAVAGAITPVPGGVGPVTVAILLRNTVRAAKAQVQ